MRNTQYTKHNTKLGANTMGALVPVIQRQNNNDALTRCIRWLSRRSEARRMLIIITMVLTLIKCQHQ